MARSRTRRHTGVRHAVIIILILAAIICVLLFVFRISTVTVTGNSRYSAEKIQQDLMDGWLDNNSLYLAWKYRSAQEENTVPYLESVQVKIQSPSDVLINVKEKQLVGTIQYNSEYACFDEAGIIMQILDTRPEDLPLVQGLDLEEPELYQKLAMANTAQRKSMLDLCKSVVNSTLDIDTISFDDNQNISLIIGDITVELGQAEYISEKIANLTAIYEKISSQKGTLNMTAFTGGDGTITFQAETEEGETETETETDITDLQNYDGTFQAFDSNGTLHNDATVVNGVVVDSNGNPIAGCSINEDGDVVDAYQNVIDTNLPVQTETETEAETAETNAAETQAETAAETTAETQPETAAETTAETSAETTAETQAETAAETTAETQEETGESIGSGVMAFDSSGTLRYDARIVNGQVVDANGTPIDGCYVNESGHIVDAYQNEIDPLSGEKLN